MQNTQVSDKFVESDSLASQFFIERCYDEIAYGTLFDSWQVYEGHHAHTLVALLRIEKHLEKFLLFCRD